MTKNEKMLEKFIIKVAQLTLAQNDHHLRKERELSKEVETMKQEILKRMKETNKVKIFAGMTNEYEILETDAPKETIIEYIIAGSNSTLPDNDPEKFFEQRGFYIDFLGCQYDDLEEIKCDYELNMYDYI